MVFKQLGPMRLVNSLSVRINFQHREHKARRMYKRRMISRA